MKYAFQLLLAFQLFVVTNVPAQTNINLTGHVFIDKNNNGIRDKNEPGIKDVVVSDQTEIVTTNADGAYRLTTTGVFGNIFVEQPNGYIIKGNFWRSLRDQRDEAVFDFPMLPAPKAGSFTFIHASDTHVSAQSLPKLERLKAITDSIKPAFVIVTGDLIKDALRVSEAEATELYTMYQTAIQKFSVPVWNVPGNHEIFGIERHKSLVSEKHPLYGKKMYRNYLGPDYYAFNYGGVHFIGLNSVDYNDLWYYGHIDSTQLGWLKKDVSFTAKQTPIITFNHIPFFSAGMSMSEYSDGEPGSVLITIDGKKYWRHVVINAEEVMKIMKDHSFPIALAGHYHAEQKLIFEAPYPHPEFHQTGAVVGPSSHGGFAMPSGVALYTVQDGKVRDRKFILLK